jgi:hypothetical protein
LRQSRRGEDLVRTSGATCLSAQSSLGQGHVPAQRAENAVRVRALDSARHAASVWAPATLHIEHPLFLHNHAAMFLILIIEALLGAVAKWHAWNALAQWIIALTCLYAVWYVYRAMRVYYAQGRGLTLTAVRGGFYI